MTPKTIALSARAASHGRPRRSPAQGRAQRGFTLIELMVGITIGLLVVAVAIAALLVSHGISGTVSDASDIQQQSAYALRLIGSQLRQTGSLRLGLPLATVAAPAPGAPAQTPSTDPMAPVAFEIKAGPDSSNPYYFDTTTATGQAALLSGTDTTLTTGFARDQVSVFGSANPTTMALNCVGGPADNNAATAAMATVQSVFDVATNSNGVPELRCNGNGFGPQPVIQNVANFQVRYLVQNTGTVGSPQVQYLSAAQVPNAPGGWTAVQGVEVCMVLYGKEMINMPAAGSTYTDCDGSTVNMATLSGLRRNRMHLVFRNVFQLRSMGVM